MMPPNDPNLTLLVMVSTKSANLSKLYIPYLAYSAGHLKNEQHAQISQLWENHASNLKSGSKALVILKRNDIAFITIHVSQIMMVRGERFVYHGDI